MTHLLVIDSDISLAMVLSDYLASRGFAAEHLHSGREALQRVEQQHFDLVLMELQQPDINGYELLRDLRHQQPLLPIVILTTRSGREDQLRAFQLGCDDYQTKPFSMDILICRIQAILRRTLVAETNRQKVFDLGGVTFDSIHQSFDGKHLSGRENDLLLLLCRNRDNIVSRHLILSSIWKEDNAFTSRSLGVYINHLRTFLRPVGYNILAVRGKGYKLVES